MRSLEVHKKLWGTARTAAQRSIPYHMMSCNEVKTGKVRLAGGGAPLGGWLGIGIGIGHWWWAISLFLTFIVIVIFPFIFRPIKLSLSQSTSVVLFFLLFPPSSLLKGSEQMAMCCWVACRVKPQQVSLLQFNYLQSLTSSSVSQPTLGLDCLLLGHITAHHWKESDVADVFFFSGHPV